MSFLKAEWRKLALANYIIDKELLVKYLPAGTVLDLWNGNCYVSLVGFMFINTKLLGVKIPLHTNFEEVNLRFYVKRFDKGEWKRGVVFIKEIVPKPAFKWKKFGKWNSIKINASIQQLEIEPNSETEFITEHYWGYAKVNDQKSNEYEVTHPKWKVYNVNDFEINVDFGNVYGKEFEFHKS